MILKYLRRSVLFISLILSAAVPQVTLEQQRQLFLTADALFSRDNAQGQAFLALNPALINYPLYPYLQYQALKNNLHQTAAITAFLATDNNSYYRTALRSKWLDYLAKNARWHEFIQYYQADDTIALDCQFYWSQYQIGQQQQALTQALRLWTTAASLPKACNPLLSALIKSPQLSSELIWQRFEHALINDNVTLAVYLKTLLDKANQNLADNWLKIHKNSAAVQDNRMWSPTMGRLFAYGVTKLSKQNLTLALTIWERKKAFFTLDSTTSQQVERNLALELAHQRDSRAYTRLTQLISQDEDTKEWAVRAALFEQNWQHVAAAISNLTPAQQQESRWQYWRARAVAALGDVSQAQQYYHQAAEDRSFYGFLAADNVNKPYNLTDKPVVLAEPMLSTLTNTSDFKALNELNALHKIGEAHRLWWFAIKKLDNEQLKIAAKLAQSWQWTQIAIITLAKTAYWDDLSLRFPINYLALIEQYAAQQQLNPAIVFGLIRQESMLDSNARSAVGALGLMQLMPETAKQMARTRAEAWQNDNSLLNPELNIKYGVQYYKTLLEQFAGQFAVATAAYNAGPNRVKKWLPKTQSMPADLWIENIPYKETRKYVMSVLSYALIYQDRLHKNELKLKHLTQDVLPR